MRFDKVLLVGSGKIACDCLNYLLTLLSEEDVTVLETEHSVLSMLRQICNKQNVEYILGEKEEAEEYILTYIRGKSTLIISANNRFIFTPAIIDSRGTVIINFHYALLPHYRGMNIPTWVIYNKEKQTGVTWHYVTEKIDHGRIISQKVIEIEEGMTAFDITRKGMLLGIEAFKEFIGVLLEKDIEGTVVEYPEDALVYRNAMLPMNGVLELPQPLEAVMRMLRCYDYGRAQVIPRLKIRYKDKYYLLEKYMVHNRADKTYVGYQISGETLVIAEKGKEIILTLWEAVKNTPQICGGGDLIITKSMG